MPYQKHRLVALQWIDNDDPTTKIEVDHINKDRTDYHIDVKSLIYLVSHTQPNMCLH